MIPFFNTAGPCLPGKHYMLPAMERNAAVLPLVENGHYFVIHAARQTGKTTLLQSLVKYLNDSGNFHALYCSVEAIQTNVDPNFAMLEIVNNFAFMAEYQKGFEHINIWKGIDKQSPSGITLKRAITNIAFSLDKPFILLFDEVDCLSNKILISFLRQLRDGYINRANIPFAHSIVLVGMRNIRGYKGKIREGKDTLGSASPFNIMTESLTVENFNSDEIASLFNQHKNNTGQKITKDAVDRIYYWTNGQPWLVNAIGRVVSEKILNKDFTKNITDTLVDLAAEKIMLKRDTHIDSLLERLKEERVKEVIEPTMIGKLDYNIVNDNTQYCIDLGIIKNENGELKPANLIYAEVIIRTLSSNTQHQLTNLFKPIWLVPDKGIDMYNLLKSFQQFWRENSEIWVEKYQYKEAAPHLILQAFLQRVINGGGSITREYATGRRRMDLCIHFNNYNYPIEIKLYYNKGTEAEGLSQISTYMDILGEDTGWLIIFNRETNISWDDKIFWKTKKENKKIIHIVGC